MTIVYKLTSQELTTYGGFKWEVGEWYETSGIGTQCSAGWLHAYKTPILALALHPTHTDLTNPILWQAEADGKPLQNIEIESNFIVCYTKMRIIEQIPLRHLTTHNRIVLGLLCARFIHKNDSKFMDWSESWLNGCRDKCMTYYDGNTSDLQMIIQATNVYKVPELANWYAALCTGHIITRNKSVMFNKINELYYQSLLYKE